jgi:hypothetical protein
MCCVQGTLYRAMTSLRVQAGVAAKLARDQRPGALRIPADRPVHALQDRGREMELGVGQCSHQFAKSRTESHRQRQNTAHPSTRAPRRVPDLSWCPNVEGCP